MAITTVGLMFESLIHTCMGMRVSVRVCKKEKGGTEYMVQGEERMQVQPKYVAVIGGQKVGNEIIALLCIRDAFISYIGPIRIAGSGEMRDAMLPEKRVEGGV
ncbi:hypothetical protein TRIATDRAFT_301329 [Trichoderma atroviride IMI 206040]|uniref:Uncharacterized protein n=1 Tax=Hypocrea atroviridis (strain ATCC 20476 / IMI 206040) TaxID=452589 RepID=G9P2T6_HYPAI|nr:uncharacterized protein TRIATDRAFT_301329 [Trichoderma atroviride IMI 206040]EHK43550.1 hypothetical protein TRIATDRAFT_301329 [Trichoderma atroviride IMI 206040]